MRLLPILLFSLAFSAASYTAFAQTARPNQCTVYKPVALDKGLIRLDDASKVQVTPYGQKPEPAQRKYWFAYSDRSENTTYQNPKDGAKPFSSLSFNEKVTIAQIKNDFALVLSDPKPDTWPKISDKATVRGWIRMSNLLLWEDCPANEFGIYNKAVICANADASTIKDVSLLGKLFSNPNKPSIGKLKTDMKFYFIMKEEGTKALLSNEYTLNGLSNKMLYGWVDKASFTPWSQRSCLEPTWEISDAEWLASNKIAAKVYKDKACKTKVVDIQYRKTSMTGKAFDPFIYRTDPYLLRYPILDGGNEKMYFCSAFANPSGHTAVSIQTGTSGQIDKLNALLASRSKVNIGIVIDGTKSMGPFYQPVKSAIEEGCKYFQNKTVKVGVVIYRDKEDGQYLTETFPMTTVSNPKLKAFLDSGGSYGVKSSASDKDMKESLYAGIDRALTDFAFKPDESNILIVVGDCGDNGKMGVTPETIVQKMISGNVSLMGFQVRNNADNAFQDFNDQIIGAMVDATQGRYDHDRQVAQTSVSIKVRAREVKGGYDMQGSGGTNLYIGMYRNAEIGKEMPGIELTSLMENSFNLWNQSVVALTDQIVKLGEGDVTYFEANDGPVDEAVTANKAAMINLLGKDTFEALTKTNSLFAFQGWTLKKEEKSGREFYKPVVFISSDEFKYLIEQLQPVYKVARSRSSSRAEYVDAMKALVKSLLPGITPEEISKKGYNEVMRLISGLNESTAALVGPSIQDIADPNVVNQGEYLSLVNAMVKKYQGLLNIQGSDYKYSREFAGIKYYWLPMEALP